MFKRKEENLKITQQGLEKWLDGWEYWLLFQENVGSIPSTRMATHNHLLLQTQGVLCSALACSGTSCVHET